MIDNLAAFLSQQLGPSPSPRTTPTPLPAPLSGPTAVTANSTCTPSPVSGVTYTANLTYGHDFNEPLYADIYRPSGATGALPAVVLIHDGGFDAGDKCDADVVGAALPVGAAGFEAVSAQLPAGDRRPQAIIRATPSTTSSRASLRRGCTLVL